MKNELLIANNFIEIPQVFSRQDKNEEKAITMIGTILNNLSYYGFILSQNAYNALTNLSEEDLVKFWKDVEKDFKEITGNNRNMDEFVVYKNFPKEVLNMSEAQYWIAQTLMYWGLPNNLFTEKVDIRPTLKEQKTLKVLSLSNEDTLGSIFNSLMNNTARWSDKQEQYASSLLVETKIKSLDMNNFSFKENGIILINEVLKNSNLLSTVNINISTATDVLRLAAKMSDGDVSLRENTKFKKFSRPERRFLLSKMDSATNLVEDLGLRKGQFKKLLSNLHPGDYNFNNVKEAYNELYRDQIKTFNSQIESKIVSNDVGVLEQLKERPGDFFRKLHNVYGKFNTQAIEAFTDIIPQLKTIQLLKLDNYLHTINDRKTLMYAPNGNWSKAQIVENKKIPFLKDDLEKIRNSISQEIGLRLNEKFPQGVDLSPETKNIKLQTNDQKLATYGRGTVFSIPESMQFIRSASYWENVSAGNTWFDNGWNFFDDNWKEKGTSCWNHTHEVEGAIFSGDPTNSKDLKGRACQMIDLNLDKLQEKGIRFAVWNILSYNKLQFEDVKDVLATLQWGEKAEEGSLYEPSRAQMVFPIKGQSMTKYVAYIDVVERKLVYMDANLYGNTSSAGNNASPLSATMPAYLDYLNSLPSVEDLFIHAQKGTTPIFYSDKGIDLEKNISAYIFQPENEKNDFQKIELSEILDGGKIELIATKKFKK